MTAREEMDAFYEEHLPDRSLGADIIVHRIGGVVVEEPDFFLLARGVDLQAPWEHIVNPAVFFPRSRQNCWYIWARGGSSLERMLTVAPYDLPWTAWSRHNKPFKVYRTRDALRLIALQTKLRRNDPELALITP